MNDLIRKIYLIHLRQSISSNNRVEDRSKLRVCMLAALLNRKGVEKTYHKKCIVTFLCQNKQITMKSGYEGLA